MLADQQRLIAGSVCIRFSSAVIRGLDALARIRTGTALATAPSRQRVYLFHHQGVQETVTSCETGTYLAWEGGSSRVGDRKGGGS
jgi:hypothetical protein